MNELVWLVPLAIAMGLVGLAAFLWSLRAGQYDDLDGAAERVLLPEAIDRPLPDDPREEERSKTRESQDEQQERKPR